MLGKRIKKTTYSCVKKGVKDIKGNLNNIRDMQKSMKAHQNESIVLTEEDMEGIHSHQDYN